MPYSKIEELPRNVRDNLPEGALYIFKEAFNSAWKQYGDPKKRKNDATREETANRIAWSAVKKQYKKDPGGDWVKK